jgi:hypothetical protein
MFYAPAEPLRARAGNAHLLRSSLACSPRSAVAGSSVPAATPGRNRPCLIWDGKN